MHTEQPGCVSRGLFALGEHFDNFCLLLGFELRATAADTAFLSGGFETRLSCR